jgi:hypothetical protein
VLGRVKDALAGASAPPSAVLHILDPACANDEPFEIPRSLP